MTRRLDAALSAKEVRTLKTLLAEDPKVMASDLQQVIRSEWLEGMVLLLWHGQCSDRLLEWGALESTSGGRKSCLSMLLAHHRPTTSAIIRGACTAAYSSASVPAVEECRALWLAEADAELAVLLSNPQQTYFWHLCGLRNPAPLAVLVDHLPRTPDPFAANHFALHALVDLRRLDQVRLLCEDPRLVWTQALGAELLAHASCLSDNVAMLDYLVKERGVSPTREEQLYFHEACHSGPLETVRFFLEQTVDPVDPFHAQLLDDVVEAGRLEVMQSLLARPGADLRITSEKVASAVVAARGFATVKKPALRARVHETLSWLLTKALLPVTDQPYRQARTDLALLALLLPMKKTAGAEAYLRCEYQNAKAEGELELAAVLAPFVEEEPEAEKDETVKRKAKACPRSAKRPKRAQHLCVS